jgi:glycerophosphoryl diester phosphodiesterase
LRLASKLEVHGHRGARAVYPENTLAGFEYAIAAGVDYIELDVVVTADDVLVACHDPVLKRRRCAGPPGTRIVRELTLEQLRRFDPGAARHLRFPRQRTLAGARIPTLEEVFSLAPLGRFGFNIEAKMHPARPSCSPAPELFAEMLVTQIRRHRLESRVIVQSFDVRVLHAVRGLAPALPVAVLCGLGARDFVVMADLVRAAQVGPYHRMVNRRRVEAAHQAGIRVVPWTANRPRDWGRLVSDGVDGIITDDPAGLIAFLRGAGRMARPLGLP